MVFSQLARASQETENPSLYSDIILSFIECSIVSHCKCSMSLPRTCGLPSQYVEHFSEAFLGSKTETSLLASPGRDLSDDGAEISMEGCLKVPRFLVLWLFNSQQLHT